MRLLFRIHIQTDSDLLKGELDGEDHYHMLDLVMIECFEHFRDPDRDATQIMLYQPEPEPRVYCVPTSNLRAG